MTLKPHTALCPLSVSAVIFHHLFSRLPFSWMTLIQPWPSLNWWGSLWTSRSWTGTRWVRLGIRRNWYYDVDIFSKTSNEWHAKIKRCAEQRVLHTESVWIQRISGVDFIKPLEVLFYWRIIFCLLLTPFEKAFQRLLFWKPCHV